MSGKLVLHGSELTLTAERIGKGLEPITKVTLQMGAWKMEIPVTQEPTNPPCVIFGGADGHTPSRFRIEIYVEDD